MAALVPGAAGLFAAEPPVPRDPPSSAPLTVPGPPSAPSILKLPGEAPSHPWEALIRTTQQDRFSLTNESQLLQVLRTKYVAARPLETFQLPLAADEFDHPDSPTLGAAWYQNRATGGAADGRGRKGDMFVRAGQAVLPARRRELAVFNEAVATADMSVSVRIELPVGGQAGLAFRSDDPSGNIEPVDALDVVSCYIALVSDSAIRLIRRERGQETALDELPISPSRSFELSVTVQGPRIVVQRDGQAILETADATLTGRHIGLFAAAGEEPVVFDDLRAIPYWGFLPPRMFCPAWSGYPAPSVRYGPIYFEHIGIERYGQHHGNAIQPFIEPGKFVLDTAVFPARLLLRHPCACDSNVGYCHPGDVVLPYRVSFPDW